MIDLLIFALGFVIFTVFSRLLNSELKAIFDTGRIIYLYPYFVFGLFVRKYEILQNILRMNVVYSLSLILFLTLFFLNTFDYSTMGSGHVLRFSAIFLLYYFFKECLAKDHKIFNYFSFLGTHSIEIYLIHFFFAFKLIELGDYLVGVTFYGTSLLIQIVYSTVVSIIIITISLGIAKIINSSKILSLLLLGKKQSFAEMFKLR